MVASAAGSRTAARCRGARLAALPPSLARRWQLTPVFAAPAAQRGNEGMQGSPEWREGVDDGALVGVIPRDEVVLFESAQGGAEDLVRDTGGDGLGQVSVSVWASVEGRP